MSNETCPKCGGTGIVGGTPDFPGDKRGVTMSMCDCLAGEDAKRRFLDGEDITRPNPSTCGNTEPHEAHKYTHAFGGLWKVNCPGVPAAPPAKRCPDCVWQWFESSGCEGTQAAGWVNVQPCAAHAAPPVSERETWTWLANLGIFCSDEKAKGPHLDLMPEAMARHVSALQSQLQQAQEEKQVLYEAIRQSMHLDFGDDVPAETIAPLVAAYWGEFDSILKRTQEERDGLERAVVQANEAAGEYEAERTFLRNYGDQKLPPGFGQRIDEWLNANQLESDKVRWGGFPLGMVRNWIDRAERAEARVKELEAREANVHAHYRGEQDCPTPDDACWGCTLRAAEAEAERLRGALHEIAHGRFMQRAKELPGFRERKLRNIARVALSADATPNR